MLSDVALEKLLAGDLAKSLGMSSVMEARDFFSDLEESDPKTLVAEMRAAGLNNEALAYAPAAIAQEEREAAKKAAADAKAKKADAARAKKEAAKAAKAEAAPSVEEAPRKPSKTERRAASTAKPKAPEAKPANNNGGAAIDRKSLERQQIEAREADLKDTVEKALLVSPESIFADIEAMIAAEVEPELSAFEKAAKVYMAYRDIKVQLEHARATFKARTQSAWDLLVSKRNEALDLGLAHDHPVQKALDKAFDHYRKLEDEAVAEFVAEFEALKAEYESGAKAILEANRDLKIARAKAASGADPKSAQPNNRRPARR